VSRAAAPNVVHQIATAVVGANLIGDVLLNIVSPSGHHMAKALFFERLSAQGTLDK
jgi:hypothetical protein